MRQLQQASERARGEERGHGSSAHPLLGSGRVQAAATASPLPFLARTFVPDSNMSSAISERMEVRTRHEGTRKGWLRVCFAAVA